MKTHLQLETIAREIEYRDPILLFHHLCSHRQNCLLLESAEIDSKRHLQSFLLVETALRLTCRGRTVTIVSQTDNGRRLLANLAEQLPKEIIRSRGDTQIEVEYPEIAGDLDQDQRLIAPNVLQPLRLLTQIIKINSSIPEALFCGGLFGYDLVECFEQLPELSSDSLACPNYVFYVSQMLIRLDHQQNSARLMGSFFYDPYERIDRREFERELDRVQQHCQHFSLLDLPPTRPESTPATVEPCDDRFRKIVVKLQDEIRRGEVFQIVPSRRFRAPCESPLRAYRQLRKTNPSPYMFLMQDQDFSLFGASPEMAVKFTAASRAVEICPIAGTRRRGKNPDGSINHDLDGRIELELRMDQKEMAEHLMLVDLARNDLARICEPGSRHVAQLLKVDRYSHVMHLVSRLVGTLRKGLDALHAYQASMNMGTLTGAPKVRAMELIREVEGRRRDSYGGGIGYFLGNGDMETCIVIRSAWVADQIATVQAGCGVVFDSVPESEVEETRNKAQAVLNALSQAHLD